MASRTLHKDNALISCDRVGENPAPSVPEIIIMRNYQLTKRSTELADLSELPLTLASGIVITAQPVDLAGIAQKRGTAALQRQERGLRQPTVCSYCPHEARCREATDNGRFIRCESPLEWEVRDANN